MRNPKTLAMLTSLVVFAVMMIGTAKGGTYAGDGQIMGGGLGVIPPPIAAVTGDLQAIAFSSMCPNPIAPGAHPQSLTFSFANNGSANFDAVTYEFYLSRNSTFGDADDVLIGQYDEQFGPEGLYPGLFEDVSISTSDPSGMGWFTIPDTAAGTYYVFFRVSPANYSSVTEVNTTNNVVCSTTAISVGVPACAYSVVGTNVTFSANGGFIYVGVNATSNCFWAADNRGNDWVRFSSPSGVGPCLVWIRAEPNDTCQTRTARVTVAGETVVVTQAAGMGTFTLSMANWSPSIAAQVTNVMVTANGNCGWAVVNPNPEWVTVSPSSGIGNGNVAIAVSRNDSGSDRSCTLTIAGNPFVITQGATCDYTITFSGGAIRAASSFTSTFLEITTEPGCSWSVTSTSEWLIVRPPSGTGSADVALGAYTNLADLSRSTVVTVAGQSFTVTQAGLLIDPVTLRTPTENETVGRYDIMFSWIPTGGGSRDWYHLCFNKDGKKYFETWVTNVIWFSTNVFAAGNYTWWVQGWNSRGIGPWSSGGHFTVQSIAPRAPELLYPCEGVALATPTVPHYWKGANATWYEISILRNGTYYIDKWVQRVDVGNTYFRDESLMPFAGHDCGQYTWQVRGWNPDGMGPWSNMGTYTNFYSTPGKITLRTPSNTVAVINEFSWNWDQSAEWYLVSIQRNGTNCLSRWVQGTGSTRTNLISSLPPGNYTWTVQGWNSKGIGLISDPVSFTVVPPGTPFSPVGTITRTPFYYSWFAQPGCTWYEVYLVKGNTTAFDKWVSSDDFFEFSRNGTKMVNVDIPYAPQYSGNYKWWVRGWGPETGYTPWSTTASFAVTASATEGPPMPPIFSEMGAAAGTADP